MSPEAKLFRKRSVNINEAQVHPDRDTQLMLEFQRGKAHAFDILFKKYSVSLVNFGYRFLGSRGKGQLQSQGKILYMGLQDREEPLFERAKKARVP
jgi:hypothetical protein